MEGAPFMKYIEAFRKNQNKIFPDYIERYLESEGISKQKINYHFSSAPINIGTIGIDKIVLTGINTKDFVSNTPLIEHAFLDKNGISYIPTELHEGHRTTISDNTIGFLGPSYIFKVGNKGRNVFQQITLFARKSLNSNLENMSFKDVESAYNEAVEDIKGYFNVEILSVIDDLRIYSCELNTTFPLNRPFAEYKRIFNIMAKTLHESTKKSKGSSTGEFGVWTKEGKYEIETCYLLKGATIQAKVYNKTSELNADSANELHLNVDTCRFELTVQEQILRKLTPGKEHEVYWRDLSQKSIDNYFTDYFSKMFENIETYFANNLKELNPHRNSSPNEQITDLYTNIISYVFTKSLRIDAASTIENIMQHFYNLEKENRAPIILDVEDLINANSILGLTDVPLSMLHSALQEIENEPKKYNVSLMNFLEQRELLEELKNNLLKVNLYYFLEDYNKPNHLIYVPIKENILYDKVFFYYNENWIYDIYNSSNPKNCSKRQYYIVIRPNFEYINHNQARKEKILAAIGQPSTFQSKIPDCYIMSLPYELVTEISEIVRLNQYAIPRVWINSLTFEESHNENKDKIVKWPDYYKYATAFINDSNFIDDDDDSVYGYIISQENPQIIEKHKKIKSKIDEMMKGTFDFTI